MKDKELAEDIVEIERIERDIRTGKEKLHKVKSVPEVFKR
jgi:hypothetical protein